jgi:hypothetical protein
MPNDDYEIGYGKPPLASRFKPGISGNPRGRPKGARNSANVLRDELAQVITITEGGKPKRITKLEAIVKAAALKGLKGDPRPMAQLLDLLDKLSAHGLGDAQGPIEVTLIFDEEEEKRELERAEREEAERLREGGT